MMNTCDLTDPVKRELRGLPAVDAQPAEIDPNEALQQHRDALLACEVVTPQPGQLLMAVFIRRHYSRGYDTVLVDVDALPKHISDPWLFSRVVKASAVDQ
jgi:hypothetical protein